MIISIKSGYELKKYVLVGQHENIYIVHLLANL